MALDLTSECEGDAPGGGGSHCEKDRQVELLIEEVCCTVKERTRRLGFGVDRNKVCANCNAGHGDATECLHERCLFLRVCYDLFRSIL